jgi:glutamyl-tRNA reductase
MVFELLTCIGISYKKSNTDVRSTFALTPTQIESIYQQSNLSHILILSTCNRTELYSFDNTDEDLFDLIGKDNIDLLKEQAYIIKGRNAFEHMVRVASGMDSQLLGDYEIAGQLKDSIKLAHRYHKLGGYFQKITNFAQSISKKIRTETNISKGSISVSKATVRYLIDNVEDINNKSILMIGAGKMGRHTMQHIVTDLDSPNLTLINRTDSVAEEIALSLKIGSDLYHNIFEQIYKADVIIMATNSPSYIIEPHLINSPKTIIDLSIPKNVNPMVGEIDGIDLIDVDILSNVKDDTLKVRKNEVSKAEQIMKERLDGFEIQITQGVEFVKKYLLK